MPSKGWFSTIVEAFIREEGKRLFYMILATTFGTSFVLWAPTEEIVGSGKTILIGVAMYCFTRARAMPKD